MNRTLPVHGTPFTFFYDEERDIERIYREVITEASYAAAECCGDDLTVLDIGANIGTFTAWIYHKAAKVYAVEPAQANFDNIVRMVQANNLRRVDCTRCAIGRASEMRYLDREHDRKHGTGDCCGYTIMTNEGAEVVPCMTLAQFINLMDIKQVDLLKIDVEGAEEEIFSAPDFASVATRIKCIIGEVHAERIIAPYLAATGYNAGWIADRENLFMAVQE